MLYYSLFAARMVMCGDDGDGRLTHRIHRNRKYNNNEGCRRHRRRLRCCSEFNWIILIIFRDLDSFLLAHVHTHSGCLSTTSNPDSVRSVYELCDSMYVCNILTTVPRVWCLISSFICIHLHTSVAIYSVDLVATLPWPFSLFHSHSSAPVLAAGWFLNSRHR